MMQTIQPLDILPLWGVFALTITLVLISMEFGFRIGWGDGLFWTQECLETTYG